MEDPSPATPASPSGFTLNRYHLAIFMLVFVVGALIAALTLQLTNDMEFSIALTTGEAGTA